MGGEPEKPQNAYLLAMTLPSFNRVSFEDKVVFTRQLATMLESGIHLVQALGIVRQQVRNQHFIVVLNRIEAGLQEGVSLSSNLAKFPDIFDRVYLNVVRSGEASGQLDNVLKELANKLERESDFRSKIRNALIYPTFILVVMIGVAILATVKIIPQLEAVFTESAIPLPISTKLIIAISDLIIHRWPLMILILVGIVVVVQYFFRSSQGQLFIDHLQVFDPTGLSQKVLMARFARTLGMLLTAGVPIVEALNVVGDVMSNRYYEEALKTVALDLERGIPMSAPLSKDKLFPAYIAQMVLIGEQTGKIDQVLMGIAEHYEELTDSAFKTITTIFEPAVIVLIGISVGVLVFSIIVPIYQITQAQ
ncbi:type II secretion system F family protein [Candidatus Berkelbacteria bacterium]|nr:type II secretion system F family protein [Candidatus Berkelbacteria bacterium]